MKKKTIEGKGEINSIKFSDTPWQDRKRNTYSRRAKRENKKSIFNCCRMLKIILDLSDTLKIKQVRKSSGAREKKTWKIPIC